MEKLKRKKILKSRIKAISSIGLLPKISERTPTEGEKTNCIKAYEEAKSPPHKAALEFFNIPTSLSKSGIIGKIIPIPIISIRTTEKIK